MDITGGFERFGLGELAVFSNLTGAFYGTISKPRSLGGSGSYSGGFARAELQASKNWSGRTSSFGRNTPNNFINPCYVLNMWVRIS